MATGAAVGRGSRNPRLALWGFPVALPHFSVDATGQLRFGSTPLKAIEPEEADFFWRCDGRTSLREIMAECPSAAGRAATAQYLVWLSEPLAPAATPRDQAAERWLVLSPHPDDAELSLGGTLLARPEGVEVRNVVCFSDVIHAQVAGAFPEPVLVATVRRDEALLAGSAINMDVDFLGFPEQLYREVSAAGRDPEPIERDVRAMLKLRLHHLIKAYQPHRVFAPAAIGNHGDHRMVFDCVIEFVDHDLFPGTAFHLYEDFPYCASGQAVDDFLARFELSYLDVSTSFVDISPVLPRKMAIAEIFRSQFNRSIATHIKRAGERTAAIAAGASPVEGVAHERYWTIDVMGAAEIKD